MKRIIVLACITTLAAGCARHVIPCKQLVSDSIIVRQVPVYSDTVVAISPDTVWLATQLPCAEAVMDTVVKTPKGKLHVQLHTGTLQVQYQRDSLLQRIRLLQYQLSREKYQTITITKPVEVKVNHVPRWMWVMALTSLALNGWMFRKPFVSLIKQLLA